MIKKYSLHAFVLGLACPFFFASCSTKRSSSEAERVEKVLASQYPNAEDAGVSVLILHKNQVVVNIQRGVANLETKEPLELESQFRMASVSKQFTAMAVYSLIQDGKLSLETYLHDVLPGLPEATNTIQIKHLLQHSSGILDYENLIPQDQKEQVLDADVFALIKNQDTVYFEPGTHFRYSNTGFCLLALVAEKVSGLPYAEFVRKSIFNPLKLDQAQLFVKDQIIPNRVLGYRIDKEGNTVPSDQSITSATKGDGCVYISTTEYAKWITAILRDSFPSKSYFSDLQRYKFPVKDDVFYSLGWFMTEDGHLFHSGETSGFRNLVYYNPINQYVVVVFSNRNESRIGDFINSILSELNIPQPPQLRDSGLFYWMSHVY